MDEEMIITNNTGEEVLKAELSQETLNELSIKKRERGEFLKEKKKSRADSIKKPRLFIKEELRGITRGKRVLTDGELRQLTLRGDDNTSLQVGFNFTYSQQRAVIGLFSLLKVKSANISNPKEENYYMGNNGKSKTLSLVKKYGIDNKAEPMPAVLTTWREAARFYYGEGKPITGTDVEEFQQIINSIVEKNYPMDITTKDGTLLRTNIPLLWKVENTTNGELLFRYNPLFTREIADNYIKMPSDLAERILRAWGNKRVPAGVSDLAQWLIQTANNKHKHINITLLHLCRIVARQKLEARKKGEALDMALRALETMRRIGVLLAFEQFDLNADLTTKIRLTLCSRYE